MGYDSRGYTPQEKKEYPAQRSQVSVTFVTGEFKLYEIDAGPGIANHLAKSMGETGVLRLSDRLTRSAVLIPRAQVLRSR